MLVLRRVYQFVRHLVRQSGVALQPRPAATEQVELRVFHNPRFLMFFTDAPDTGHVVEVFRAAAPADLDPADLCKAMFELLNVGDELPSWVTRSHAAAYRAYRAAGLRSLSVNDVVAVGNRFYRCDPNTWTPIEQPGHIDHAGYLG